MISASLMVSIEFEPDQSYLICLERLTPWQCAQIVRWDGILTHHSGVGLPLIHTHI